VDATIASRAADITEFWDVIDFTDDPGGFAGEIPGSSPWPLAKRAGVAGTGATLNNNFCARISGVINISAADTYRFRTYSDDGVRLRVGGTTVINDNSYHRRLR
jgi:PA14 domain